MPASPHCEPPEDAPFRQAPTAPPRVRISARLAFITTAFVFGLLLAAPLAWFNYAHDSDAALSVARELAQQTADIVTLRARLLVEPLNILSRRVALLPGANVRPKGFRHPLLPLLLDHLKNNPQLYSLYFGYADGEFLQAIALGNRRELRRSLNAPEKARYALRNIAATGGRRTERWRFLDAERRVVSETPPLPAGYDPRTRPWYAKALTRDAPLRSKPYVFSSSGGLGLTLSRRVRRGKSARAAVFGADMSLDVLSSFLAHEKIGRRGTLFIFDADGLLVGHPDIGRVSRPGPDGRPRRADVASLHDPRALAVLRRYREVGRSFGLTALDVDGATYLAQVTALNGFGPDRDYLALVLDPKDFTGAIARTRNQSLLFALALILVAVPGLSLLAGEFSRSMRLLAEEADRIRGLRLDSNLRLRSRIDEMDRLGAAMAGMRGALAGFSRYVPRSLVRSCVESGADPVLGGTRREITLLFTDVEKFTPLAERLAPEELMRTMSEYFQAVGQAILDGGGTIDKFIGDGVMAFWNAPSESPDHVEQACAAALCVARAANELNARRAAAALPLLRTRLGLHTGPAVVGNLGLADRMDYTALGATVNLASRMEGLNKRYGTQILVSRAVRDRVRRKFLFRSVDMAEPKGLSAPVAVFALVGVLPNSAAGPECPAAPAEELGFCARWEHAVALLRTAKFDRALAEFTLLAQERPDDRLAILYRARARRLAEKAAAAAAK